MIIPAAGVGSRLKSETPKILFPVNGRPMIDYLFDLYATVIDRFVLVIHPSSAPALERHCAGSRLPIELEFQTSPTGMLDAIMIPQNVIRRQVPDQVLITWCDQIAVRPQTVQRLIETANARKDAAVVMPTIIKPQPYIHWVRNDQGKIVGLLQRREGDAMPDIGEGDIGLFALSGRAYLDLLPRFAAEAGAGSATEERNFLPFIPWLEKQPYDGIAVSTFPATSEIESVGINTRDDLAVIEQHLNNERTQAFSHHSSL